MRAIFTFVFGQLLVFSVFASGTGRSLPLPFEDLNSTNLAVSDTIPVTPRYNNFTNDPNRNPFDLTPSIVEQKVEYDPITGNYIIFEKIGDEYFRTPTYMTFSEYFAWKSKQQEKDYFNQLAGINSGKKGRRSVADPMERIDIQKNLVDRLFGGSEVDIQPQGNIDLTFGLDYYKNENPNIPLRQQSPGVLFDFDMDIEMSVTGNIGKKLNLDFNYDTQATFDFDRQIKLGFDSEQFGEDDIIKKIEAGNVSLPLRSNLIQGVQNLFGLKTEMQFGHLKVIALASQQRSERENIRIENGAANQRIEIRPDEYDENRHFFLSHFNRDCYEESLQNIPFIATSFRISRIEVWISEDRTDYQQGSKIIAAISDLAEPDPEEFTNPNANYDPPPIVDPLLRGVNGKLLADNRTNPLYEELQRDNEIDDIDKTSTLLKSKYNMQQTRDFEVFRGRKLNPSEFTFNEQLGFISLNQRLRPNQVLGVAYQYYYTANCDEVYQVGDMSSEGEGNTVVRTSQQPQEPVSPNLTFVKMLKSTNQRVNLSTWDLMMKNVYALNASNLGREDFEFDIFFEDDQDGSLKKYLPFGDLAFQPLLNVFNLDNVNTQMDPQPDGIFDYIPGITVIPRNGSIVFPVLEPFGSSLERIVQGIPEAEQFVYQELYDTTLVGARETLEKNKFVMRARVQSEFSGDIQLGPFVPRGSVRVTAGGRTLVEGQDYEIDYSLGRLRVINPAYLQQGTPVNVSFENNSLFNLQQKTMLGLRAEYEFSEKLNVGATYLRLFERPFTQKVNLGQDPINNRVFGLDLNYSTESSVLTKLIDGLPFYSTKEPSFLNFSAEVAALKPGHSGAINLSGDDSGVVNIDDFEGTINGLLLGTTRTNDWVLASVPSERPEADETTLTYGANRALLNWYVIDNAARNASPEDRVHPYSRIVQQTELFPNRTVQPGLNLLFTFDMSYYPTERGPYNFDVPGGTQYSAGIRLSDDGEEIILNDPQSRWAGIMRYFSNTDFQAANYESIEFWMLNPFMERRDGQSHQIAENGKMVFQLGSISEDVLNDNRQFYENSIPIDPALEVNLVQTIWGRVSNIIPVVDGFDQVEGAVQDLGFDGLTDSGEAEKFQDWLQTVGATFPVPTEVLQDPANDNYLYFNSDQYDASVDLVTRYKDFNNPQGNAPLTSRNESQERLRGNPRPDKEDLNNNKSLDEAEAYYEYELPIINVNGEVDMTASEYIREMVTVVNEQSGSNEKWYRVRIPLTDGRSVNGIQGFRAIQFMRMFVTGYSSAKTFRMAEFQLRRNQWRIYPAICADDSSPDFDFVLDDVGIEENSEKQPFNYVMPRGIQRERVFSTFANLQQDEKSMQINFCGMGAGCQGSLYKLTELDLTYYKRLQMFVHAEKDESDPMMEDGDVTLMLRVGKDFENNYYEYEMPLVLSERTGDPRDPSMIWLDTNYIDVELEKLSELKIMRAEAGLGGLEPFGAPDPDNPRATRRVVGNPSLGYIKMIQIVVRNTDEDQVTHCGEVWINELRASGLEQRGGYAGVAQLQMQLADLGEVNMSGSYSSIGWGGIDESIQERAREETVQYDISTNLQLGKFLPSSLGLSIPFYAQYSKLSATPLYDPYQLDLTTEQTQLLAQSEEERQEIADRAKETTTIKAFNFTNVKKTSSGGSKKPWSIDNFSATYSFSETVNTDPIIRENKVEESSLALDYSYSRSAKYWEPFKGLGGGLLKLISSFNINPLPNSFRFTSKFDRLTNSRTFRFPDRPVFTFDNKRFLWDRRYNLNWDLARSLKIDFSANSSSMIDELRQTGIADDPDDRPWVNERGEDFTDVVAQDPGTVRRYWWDNLTNLGRAKGYDHQLRVSYTFPIKLIPMMDWITLKGDYTTDYTWQAAPLIIIDELGNGPGNTIQNSQIRSLDATFNFEQLYGKWGYLKKIESGSSSTSVSRRTRTTRRRAGGSTNNNNQDEAQSEEEESERNPSVLERILIRPLLSLRDMRINYRENLSTLLPAFNPEASLLGMSSGFDAPGWGFVFGGQPNLDPTNQNNWLFRAADNGWINTSPNINDQISQIASHNLDISVALEPFKDFQVDLDFKKSYRRTHTEVFKNKNAIGDPEFLQLAGYDVGSFEESYLALGTLFGNDPEALYALFKDNREIISYRLPNVDNPGEHPDDPGYAQGYGERNYDVIVPAFLSAYEGSDPNTYPLDLENRLSQNFRIPAPEWTVRYDGLKNLPIFKNLLSGFSLTHAYRSSLKVNRFNSIPNYDPTTPFSEFDSGNNYYTRLEIPAMSIAESFAPLIGLSFKTKNDMNFDFQYTKSRQLNLALQTDLRESRSSGIVLGFGYTIQNFQGFGGGGNDRRNRRGQNDEANPDNNNRPRGRVNSSRGRTLSFNLDFSIRDDISYVFNFLAPVDNPEPERGVREVSINPNIDYDINENLTLRFFTQYRRSEPKTSLSYTTTNINGGVTLRFKLN